MKQGDKDVQAWSKVPENQRQAVYEDYVNDLKYDRTSNYGINSYFRNTSKYQRYVAYYKRDGDNKYKWHLIREYSYPYKTRTEYNRALKQYIKKIDDGFFDDE